MLNKQRHSILIFFLISCIGFSQTETDSTKTEISTNLVVIDSVVKKPIDALSPSKAAFYSAVLPGLGQAYNKKYWKIPIVYAAIGTGVYFYIQNDKDYDRYRDAYKRRLAGFTDDEFYGPTPGSPRVTSDGLIRAQQTLKRNKELSLLVTIGFYALNIINIYNVTSSSRPF